MQTNRGEIRIPLPRRPEGKGSDGGGRERMTYRPVVPGYPAPEEGEREATPPVEGGAPRAGRPHSPLQSPQEQWLNARRRSGTPLLLHCADGSRFIGRLIAFDPYSLLLADGEGREHLFFKHAILHIEPWEDSGPSREG